MLQSLPVKIRLMALCAVKLNLATKCNFSLIKLFLRNISPVVCVFDLNACGGDGWGKTHGGGGDFMP